MSDEQEAPQKKHGKPGLKARRGGKRLLDKCDNCKCQRYSPCGCQRKEK